MGAARGLLALLTAGFPVTLCGAGEPSEARAEHHSLIVTPKRATVSDALRASNVLVVQPGDWSDDSHLATDGREDTVWTGRADLTRWTWTARFVRPAHLALVRARWGASTPLGVPVAYDWEALAAGADGDRCEPDESTEDLWMPLAARCALIAFSGAFSMIHFASFG